MTQTTTITHIRDDLITVFNGLKNGTMDIKEAFELNNTAGKIISSAKVQLAYHALRGEKPDIPFLNSAPTTIMLDATNVKQIG